MRICTVCGDELAWSEQVLSDKPFVSMGLWVHTTSGKDHKAVPSKVLKSILDFTDVGRWETKGGHTDED